MEYVSIVISLVAIVISVLSLLINFKFGVKAKIVVRQSFIIDGISSSNGNRASVLLCIDISNNSVQPITIFDIGFSRYKGAMFISPSKIPKDFKFSFYNGDIDEQWNPSQVTPNFPLRLAPYDFQRIYLLFEESFCKNDSDYETIKLHIITPRKTIKATAKLSTDSVRSKWFQ